MIQFLKGHTHRNKKYVIGQKGSFIPELELEWVRAGIAQRTTWDGKTEKLKTDFFKPKTKK